MTVTSAHFISEISCDDWGVSSLQKVGCLFDPKNYSDELFADLSIVFPNALKGAVIKRKAEFLAGRFCARRAQVLLGTPPVDVGIGSQREPIWPPTVKASISHSRKMAMCVASLDTSILGIGVDIEDYLDQETAAQVQCDILTSYERRLLSLPGLLPEQIVTLIFSAKESFYKAAFPLVKRFLDFDTVSIVELDVLGGKFQFRMNQFLHPMLQIERVWEGRFCICNHEKLQFPVLKTLVVLGSE